MVPDTPALYHHSGHLGDIIYGLPGLQKIGPVDLEISPITWQVNGVIHKPILQEDFEAIAPLLRSQTYIRSVRYVGKMSPSALNLDGWRTLYMGNIAKSHLRMLKDSTSDFLKRPWIKVEPVSVAPMIVSRSPRWHEAGGTEIWRHVIDMGGSHAVFVGLQKDWEQFVAEVGQIRFHPTRSLLEAAQTIAGSEVFIGNQSACLAIAQGLHHPRIAYERSKVYDNCDIAEIPTVKFDETSRMEQFIAAIKC
jgi:hypothetical protein